MNENCIFSCGVDEVNASWLWTILNSVCFGFSEYDSKSDSEFDDASKLSNFHTLSKNQSFEKVSAQGGKPPLYPIDSRQ